MKSETSVDIQKLPVAVIVLDRAWFVTSVNPAFCDLFGCDSRDVVTRSFEDLINPADHNELQVFEQKMKSAGAQAFYIRLDLRMGGRDYPARIRAESIGSSLMLFVERLEVDQQLRDQLTLVKKRWTAVHEFIEDGILVVDQDLNIVEVNQQVLNAMDFRTQDGIVLGEELLIGKNLFAFLDEKEFLEIKASVEASRVDPDKVSSGNYWFRNKLLNIRTSPIFIPKKGFQGSCLVVRDITDQYRAEETLLKKTIVIQLLQSVAVASNEAKTARAALHAAVKNVCLYTGWSVGHVYMPAAGIPDELISSDIWFPERSPGTEAVIQAAEWASFRNGEDLPGRVMASCKPEWIADMTKEPAILRTKIVTEHGLRCAFAFPVLLADEVAAVLEFFSPHPMEVDRSLLEISVHLGAQLARVFERENAQNIIGEQQVKIAANSKLSALGEMAGGIAHEINNPLAVIHTLSGQLKEIAAEGELNVAVVTKIANTIESTAMRIAKIIKGLRSFARDGEKDPYDSVNIRSIVEDTMAFCVERLKTRGISIGFEDHSNDVALLCRGVQIAQVVLNLVNNAHDAIGDFPNEQAKWIKIETWERGNYVEINVTDSGKGIPLEIQERVFQPFFTTKDIGKGTGMGLSISRAIVNDHQGELFLDSAHENTRFVILLPKAPKIERPA